MSEDDENSSELHETYASEIVPSLAPADVYDPVIEFYKRDVDRTLLRENLKLTPGERAERMLRNVRAIENYRQCRGWK